MTTAALGIGLIPDWLSESARKDFAVQLFSVREAVAKNLEETLSKLRTIGFNKLEIYGYDGKFFGHSAADFNAILKRTGMQVISSHHLTGLGMKMPSSLTAGWDTAVEDLAAIRAKYAVCAFLFPDERKPEIYQQLPDLLNKSGEISKAAGVQFGYHNHDFEFEPMGDKLVYDFLLENTDPAKVIFEMDLYWTNKAGQDPLAWFDKHPGRFPLWHVKDMEAGSKDITQVGDGTIDFARIFAARKKAGLKYWFVEQDTTKGEMFASLKKSHDYLMTRPFAK